MSAFLDECFAILERTPAALDALLRDLPDAWLLADEGPGTWNPRVVIGHLTYADRVDWLPRLRIILDHGTARPFEPFDREGHFSLIEGKPVALLLDEFTAARRENLRHLRELNLQPAQLELQGTHPALGVVTVRQLLATWTAHDMAHLTQISRTLAKRFKQEVGPWAQFLSVMK